MPAGLPVGSLAGSRRGAYRVGLQVGEKSAALSGRIVHLGTGVAACSNLAFSELVDRLPAGQAGRPIHTGCDGIMDAEER